MSELVQETERCFEVPEAMPGQKGFPLAGRALELARKPTRRFRVLILEQPVVNLPDSARMVVTRHFECLAAGESHERGQARAGPAMGGDRMRLQVMLHLQTMFDVAQEAIGGGQRLRFHRRQELVLRQLLQYRQGLPSLQKRQPAGVEQLLGLDNEFNFTNAAASQLDIAVDLTGLDHLGFEARFHGGYFAPDICPDGTRVAERLDHFQKFRRKRKVAGDAPGLHQHHSFPGLAPLRVEILVTAERARQRTGATFGAQTEVNPKEAAVGRGAADLSDE